jgi:hypothetical protein
MTSETLVEWMCDVDNDRDPLAAIENQLVANPHLYLGLLMSAMQLGVRGRPAGGGFEQLRCGSTIVYRVGPEGEDDVGPVPVAPIGCLPLLSPCCLDVPEPLEEPVLGSVLPPTTLGAAALVAPD